MTLITPEDSNTVRFASISVKDTIPLRQSVLWPDKPRSQVELPEDESGWHYGAFLPDQDNPVAVISLFSEDIPIDNQSTQSPSGVEPKNVGRTVRFRKFACDAQYQSRGIGSGLLFYALSIARSKRDAMTAWCDARTATTEWYKRRGFSPFGTTFYKSNVEYIRMKMDLVDETFRRVPTVSLKQGEGSVNGIW